MEDDEREHILGNVQRIELSGGRVCSDYSEAQRLEEEICTTRSVVGGGRVLAKRTLVIENVQKTRKMLSVGEGGRRP